MGQGEGGMIWENGIETCIISYVKRITSPGLMYDCSGLPFPSPGDLPDPGIEPRSPALQADSLPSEPPTLIFFSLWYSIEKLICLLLKTIH